MIILIIIVSIMIIRQSNDDHQVWSSTTAAGWRDVEILPVLALLTLFALPCRSPPSWMISSPFSFPLVSKLFRITLAGLHTWGQVPSYAALLPRLLVFHSHQHQNVTQYFTLTSIKMSHNHYKNIWQYMQPPVDYVIWSTQFQTSDSVAPIVGNTHIVLFEIVKTPDRLDN